MGITKLLGIFKVGVQVRLKVLLTILTLVVLYAFVRF